MKLEERKFFNNNLFEKILDFMENFYPGIYENSKERYSREEGDRFKILKNDKNYIEDYNCWFLLKMVLENRVTVAQMVDSFPEDYFDSDEKRAIKNLLNYKESIFKIFEISEDNKIYAIKDLMNDKMHKIKTFDLAPRFKEGDIIHALIIKDIENNYFFFGGIQSFEIKDSSNFFFFSKFKLKIENELRKEREKLKIDWKFIKKGNENELEEKDFLENESEVWENKTKINGIWVDDETGEVLEDGKESE